MTFTCTADGCGHRSTHEFAKRSYTKGIVLVQCPSCKNRHLIADHIGWFKVGRAFTRFNLPLWSSPGSPCRPPTRRAFGTSSRCSCLLCRGSVPRSWLFLPSILRAFAPVHLYPRPIRQPLISGKYRRRDAQNGGRLATCKRRDDTDWQSELRWRHRIRPRVEVVDGGGRAGVDVVHTHSSCASGVISLMFWVGMTYG